MVVKDMDAATTYWSEQLGVGPWVVIQNSGEDRDFIHRGRRTDIRMDTAFAYNGESQIELISQTNDAPSVYKEFLDAGREGLQHLGFWPDDIQHARTELLKSGFDEIFSVFMKDGARNVSYFTSPPILGIMVELAPMTAFRQAYMQAIERLSQNWDGTRPVRKFKSREEFLKSDDFRSTGIQLP
jgi:catechol 2,3-dioxygenase-like lactoylglutathione lyase family enzyme